MNLFVLVLKLCLIFFFNDFQSHKKKLEGFFGLYSAQFPTLILAEPKFHLKH